MVESAMLHLSNLSVGSSLLLKYQVLSEVKNILDFMTKNKQIQENPKQNWATKGLLENVNNFLDMHRCVKGKLN